MPETLNKEPMARTAMLGNPFNLLCPALPRSVAEYRVAEPPSQNSQDTRL